MSILMKLLNHPLVFPLVSGPGKRTGRFWFTISPPLHHPVDGAAVPPRVGSRSDLDFTYCGMHPLEVRKIPWLLHPAFESRNRPAVEFTWEALYGQLIVFMGLDGTKSKTTSVR